MARRGIFKNISGSEPRSPEREASPSYSVRGATRNMLASIGELAEKAAKADQMLEGEVVVELDPNLIDMSFISDRMEDDEAIGELVEAIRSRGQDSPILVRRHPTEVGRYQTVFGHRRLKAARELGAKVKAVVRDVSDVDHVIAQGQENAARENLSFIERALFAKRLVDQGYDRQTVQTALAVDAPMLTRMLSVSSRVSESLARAIGPSKSVGRDRWIEFAQLIESPEAKSVAEGVVTEEKFSMLSSDQRFETVFAALKAGAKRRRSSKPTKSKWEPLDKMVAADVIDTGRLFSLSFRAKVSVGFGRFVAENLELLYEDYKRNHERRG